MLYCLNDSLGRSYGFTVDGQTDLDAVSTGNLMRFANHTAKQVANCNTDIRFARGTSRACLVSTRFIKAGEELFFDYNFNKKLDWLDHYNIKFIDGFIN